MKSTKSLQATASAPLQRRLARPRRRRRPVGSWRFPTRFADHLGIKMGDFHGISMGFWWSFQGHFMDIEDFMVI